MGKIGKMYRKMVIWFCLVQWQVYLTVLFGCKNFHPPVCGVIILPVCNKTKCYDVISLWPNAMILPRDQMPWCHSKCGHFINCTSITLMQWHRMYSMNTIFGSILLVWVMVGKICHPLDGTWISPRNNWSPDVQISIPLESHHNSPSPTKEKKTWQCCCQIATCGLYNYQTDHYFLNTFKSLKSFPWQKSKCRLKISSNLTPRDMTTGKQGSVSHLADTLYDPNYKSAYTQMAM